MTLAEWNVQKVFELHHHIHDGQRIDAEVLGDHRLAGDRLLARLIGRKVKTDFVYDIGARHRARQGDGLDDAVVFDGHFVGATQLHLSGPRGWADTCDRNGDSL